MASGALKFELDERSLARFRRKVQKISAETGLESGQVLREVMRGVVINLSTWFPPRRPMQGKNRIKKEVSTLVELHSARSFNRMEKKYKADRAQTRSLYEELETEGLLRFLGIKWTPENIVRARTYTKQMGTAEGVVNTWLDRGAKQLPELHQRSRRTSDGRVAQLRAQRGGGTIGIQKYVDQLIVKKTDFNRYLKTTVFPKVGKLKSGWNAGAELWRVMVPNWVWAHGTGNGTAVDKIRPNGSGYLEMVNKVPYAGRQSGAVRRALNLASRITQQRLERLMKKKASAFNAAS